jgi:hypothetical protein
MPSYQLKYLCLFVDARDHDTNQRKPDELPAPHVMNKNVEPADYLKLNDGAAFIARFLVMGLDTDLIAQIIRSEYGDKVKHPLDEVMAVVAMLGDYLEVRSFDRPYQSPKEQGRGKHVGRYALDFKVNWFGTGVFKGPL